MFLLNGKKIDINNQITIDGVTYPHLRDVWQEKGVIQVPTPERPDPRFYFITENLDGSLNVEAKNLDMCKDVRISEIAQERFRRETAGVTLQNGTKIRTDRESQSQLNNAFVSLYHGFIPSTPWKAANGWAPMTIAEIEPVARAVALHVRDSFLWEEQQTAIVNAMTTVEDVIAYTIPAI